MGRVTGEDRAEKENGEVEIRVYEAGFGAVEV
jgi:hypothetical protein